MLTLSRLLFIRQIHAWNWSDARVCRYQRPGLRSRLYGDGNRWRFITARQFPQMVKFTPSPLYDGIHLTAVDGSGAMVRFSDFSAQEGLPSMGESLHRADQLHHRSTSGSAVSLTCDVQLRWLGPHPAGEALMPSHSPSPMVSLSAGYFTARSAKRCPASVQNGTVSPLTWWLTGAAAWEERIHGK